METIQWRPEVNALTVPRFYRFTLKRVYRQGAAQSESAIRRIIHLCIKGAGIFWLRDHAENIIMLRASVLTGRLKVVC